MLYTVPMKKIRLDTLLVEQGYFADADAALRAVLAHEVKVGDVYATSAAVRVAPDAEVVVKNRKRFVSRGGHKLQGALDAFGQDVRGLRCLDIGSSTGGFSDCLLQAGAKLLALLGIVRQPVQHAVEMAGGFASRHHGAEQSIEAGGIAAHRLRQRMAFEYFAAHPGH